MQCSSTGTEAPGRDNWGQVITTHRNRVNRITGASFSLLLGVCSSVVAAKPDNLLGIISNSAGVEAGLCVHIGSTDGTIEIQMARNGRRLVHGLALDDQSLNIARKAIQAEGLYPLASVEKTSRRTRGGTLEQLPYADNLVSLLIADLDALGKRTPPHKEIMRVVYPNAVACLKKDGKWTAITKPRPEEMDERTHFDYDAGGNVVWRNTEVAGKHIGQLIYNDGYLALFGPGGIGAGKDPFTGCSRVNDAKLLWTGTFPTTWNRAGYRIVPSSALNDILRSDGDLLSLPAGRDQRFTFDPQMTDAELKQKLQTNPPAKH